MNSIKAGYEILKPIDGKTPLQQVEKIARVCYKSEGLITEDGQSAVKLIKKLIGAGHEAMLEHWTYIFKLDKADFIWLKAEIEYLELSEGYRCFLKMTIDKDRYIVSGNVRAWRDLMKAFNDCPNVCTSRKNFVACMLSDNEIKRVFFEGVIDPSLDSFTPCNDLVVEELSISDLTQYEQMIHGVLSVKFICDRGVSHELVRHRVMSFAQESTRYCNYSKDKYGNECTFIRITDGMGFDMKCRSMTCGEVANILSVWEEAMNASEKYYMDMLELGAPPQIARSVLPNSVKTEITMSGTYRDWVHFFELRVDPAAHPQMRELTIPLLQDVKKLIPDHFSNIQL